MSIEILDGRSEESLISSTDLRSAGCSEKDIPQILKMAQDVDPFNYRTILDFGRSLGEESDFTQQILSRVKTSDIESVDKELRVVMKTLRELKGQSLVNDQSKLMRLVSRVPIVNKVFNRTVDTLRDSYQSADSKINGIVQDVSVQCKELEATNEVLDKVYKDVVEEYRLAGMYSLAGQIALKRAKELYAESSKDIGNDMDIQNMSDLGNNMDILEKRIREFDKFRKADILFLPSIRAIQAGNIMMIEKFETVNKFTVAIWRRGFIVSGALTQQQDAVGLSECIDNTTEKLLEANARKLHSNVVRTAKANKAPSIKDSTISIMHTELTATMRELGEINELTKSERLNIIQQLTSIVRPSLEYTPDPHKNQ